MKTSTPSKDAAPFLVVAAGALAAAAQLLMILIYAVGNLLITPVYTFEEIANGEDGFHFWQITFWIKDSWTYAVLLALVCAVVAAVWIRRDRLQPWVKWAVFSALVLVIPAQLTVLDPIFN